MLKKNILCLVMAAVMTFGTATTAKAEEITSSKDWTVDFKNDKLNSNFTSKEIAEEVYGMLPGDTMKIGVKIKNSESIQTDWYMSNEILKVWKMKVRRRMELILTNFLIKMFPVKKPYFMTVIR